MIKIENISKSFDQIKVVDNISTEFEKGKTNLIIGQSGSGKTVLMKCLVGLLNSDQGKIFFDDKRFDELSFSNLSDLRKEIGMVFQGTALFDSMSVLENIIFPLRMFTNKSNDEMIYRGNEVIKRVDLKDANNKLPSEISGGMKKRVAIARAIVLNPKYLFCDEPNSGLDPRTSIVIDELLSDITHEYNITTIINTHDMNSVLGIGENIVFINKGHREWVGNMKEIYRTENEALNDFVFATDLFQRVRQYVVSHEHPSPRD